MSNEFEKQLDGLVKKVDAIRKENISEASKKKKISEVESEIKKLKKKHGQEKRTIRGSFNVGNSEAAKIGNIKKTKEYHAKIEPLVKQADKINQSKMTKAEKKKEIEKIDKKIRAIKLDFVQ